jgi:hypothetical protein
MVDERMNLRVPQSMVQKSWRGGRMKAKYKKLSCLVFLFEEIFNIIFVLFLRHDELEFYLYV